MQVDVRAMYERYGPMVFRRCRALLRDEERALDAMQETFVLLLQNRHRLDASRPSGLLLRIATNHCLNLLRSDRRRPEDPMDALVHRIACADDPEARSLARAFLDRLFARGPASTRALAVMHWVDGMTLEEVAREAGLSVSGVRKRLRTLRARIHDLPEIGP